MSIALGGALALPAMAQRSGGMATTPSNPNQSPSQMDQQIQNQQIQNQQPENQTKNDKSSMPQSDAGNTTNMKTVSRKDRLFMEKAAAGGLMEVDLGNAVKDKAQDPQVKDFATKMVTDHSKANDDLKSLMSEKGLSAPTDLPARDKAQVDKITAKSGADLDKSYMADMVRDHNKDVKEFQDAAKNADNPDVKAFAAKTLPTLQEHQKMAKDVAQKVGAKGNTKGQQANNQPTDQTKNP
jgi:putative membrane protein